MKKTLISLVALTGVAVFGMTGCASKKYVDSQLNEALSAEISEVHTEMRQIRQDVDTHEQEIQELKVTAEEQEEKLNEKLGLIEDALARAEKANKLSKGKLLYEVTISDESVPFAYNKSELSEDAKAQLNIFAGVLIEENDDIYIEIQGHTDNVGSEKYNLELGQARADAVRAWLREKHNIPLHKMSTFSYGESKPVAENDTAENRARNRRVVLLVME
ncbi:OmpA family protein [Desulfonema ishimotonii]|uniref:OmpA family protein n=1 Tax=Desulfonema ishimotonii TaxID=45657 RepID=A0A401FU23_9BACT|nr:OmpA family protein [Desulfonema ishimotonii]GBC60438.1 OmpA family protein [Desulfonema ishimotonii]